jgi:hypothetical protein
MASDHLNELRRQRAQVQQHLDWLDREIVRHQPADTGPAINPTIQNTAEAASAADLIMPEPDPVSAGQNAKRGCLLSFFGLLALLAGLLIALYFWKYRDRPLLFAERVSTEVIP